MTFDMENMVAFIPVRGGSKSIPFKNIKEFCGKPLIYWTAKAANDCDYIDKVYICTDSERIKRVAIALDLPKVEVIGRSSQTATDTASTESAMLDFANMHAFKDLILIQATSPLLEKSDLDGACRKYLEGRHDSLLSVVRQKRFIWKTNKDAVSPVNYQPSKRPRRQDMEGYLVENGAFYITGREALLETGSRLSGKIGAYEMSEKTYFEIDEPSDWIIMEQLKRVTVQPYLS